MQLAESELRAGLIGYIANRMGGEERLRFEERLLADQEFSDAAAAVEQDLIDDYAAGRLAKDEHAVVEQWIAGSPARQQRVRMAGSLFASRHKPARRNQQIAAWLALAACIAGAAVLVMHSVRQRNVQRRETAMTPKPPATLPLAAIKPDVILLSVAQVRGLAKGPSFTIHRDAPVTLQVVMPGEDERKGYGLRVVALEGKERTVFEEKGLDANAIVMEPYLEVNLPAGTLAPGAYAAVVSRGGSTSIVRFRVQWAQ